VPERNISITYLQFFTPELGVHGHETFPPFSGHYSGEGKCQPGECGGSADWLLTLPLALATVVLRLRPSILVLNSGHWGSSNDWPVHELDRVMALGIKAVQPQGGRAFWKTTTERQHAPLCGRDHDAQALAAAERHGWKVFDAWALTHSLTNTPGLVQVAYWDNLHFHSFIYDVLNAQLLDMF